MKLPLAYFGDPVLRKKGAPVSEITSEIRQLIQDMAETMEANDGCGLAAPQVHQSLALFITCIPHYDENDKKVHPGELRVFINPKIVAYTPEEWACEEGCLSIPGVRAVVSRPLKVIIQATDLDGKEFVEEFVGFDAHVILHENDHINGVLYIDRLSPKKKKELEPRLREIKKKFSSKK
jgi:peptide deformylase